MHASCLTQAIWQIDPNIHPTPRIPHTNKNSEIHRGQPSTCLLCSQETGTFYHLLWSCPYIQGFWKQVVDFLHDNMGSPLTLDPKPCLLGIFPDADTDKYTKTFMQETLFSARKTIAKLWMRQVPPSLTGKLTLIAHCPIRNLSTLIEGALQNIRSGTIGLIQLTHVCSTAEHISFNVPPYRTCTIQLTLFKSV